jgi:hypothetical protein
MIGTALRRRISLPLLQRLVLVLPDGPLVEWGKVFCEPSRN